MDGGSDRWRARRAGADRRGRAASARGGGCRAGGGRREGKRAGAREGAAGRRDEERDLLTRARGGELACAAWRWLACQSAPGRSGGGGWGGRERALARPSVATVCAGDRGSGSGASPSLALSRTLSRSLYPWGCWRSLIDRPDSCSGSGVRFSLKQGCLAGFKSDGDDTSRQLSAGHSRAYPRRRTERV